MRFLLLLLCLTIFLPTQATSQTSDFAPKTKYHAPSGWSSSIEGTCKISRANPLIGLNGLIYNRNKPLGWWCEASTTGEIGAATLLQSAYVRTGPILSIEKGFGQFEIAPFVASGAFKDSLGSSADESSFEIQPRSMKEELGWGFRVAGQLGHQMFHVNYSSAYDGGWQLTSMRQLGNQFWAGITSDVTNQSGFCVLWRQPSFQAGANIMKSHEGGTMSYGFSIRAHINHQKTEIPLALF